MGRRLTREEFIERAKAVHGNKYIYDLVEFKNLAGKVKIICNIHKIFEQQASSHLQGFGCSKCSVDKTRFSKNVFIEKSKKNSRR